MATSARDYHQQLVHYHRITLNFNSAASGVDVVVGVIPPNAILLNNSGVSITTPFNAVTTNVIDVGYAADSLSAGDPNAYGTLLAAGAVAFVPLDELLTATAKPRPVATTVVASY